MTICLILDRENTRLLHDSYPRVYISFSSRNAIENFNIFFRICIICFIPLKSHEIDWFLILRNVIFDVKQCEDEYMQFDS